MENRVGTKSSNTAKVNASSILAITFKKPQDFILKMLHNAPFALFSNVSNELSDKANTRHSNLDIDITEVENGITTKQKTFEISLHISNILKLPTVINQLSTFLNCTKEEALNKLSCKSGILISGATKTIANALQKQIDATVCFTNPKNDFYTIVFKSNFPTKNLNSILAKIHGPVIKFSGEETHIENLNYAQSTSIIEEYFYSKKLTIINQSHQQCNIDLLAFNPLNVLHVMFLTSETGMPKSVITKIKNNLPIRICEIISAEKATGIVEKAQKLNIETLLITQDNSAKSVFIENIKEPKKVKALLKQFIKVETFKNNATWESNEKIPMLIARYLKAELERLNCTVSLR